MPAERSSSATFSVVRLRPVDAAHRVAGGVVLHQAVDRLDHLGDAFFAEGLPPPGRRTRPGSMSPASSSRRPRPRWPGRCRAARRPGRRRRGRPSSPRARRRAAAGVRPRGCRTALLAAVTYLPILLSVATISSVPTGAPIDRSFTLAQSRFPPLCVSSWAAVWVLGRMQGASAPYRPRHHLT